MFIVIGFLIFIGLLFFQNYLQFGDILPIIYFIGLIIIFLIK
jgi:hypothetical protein